MSCNINGVRGAIARGRDIWFPKTGVVLFEGTDDGKIGWAWLFADDDAFDVAAESPYFDGFYEVFATVPGNRRLWLLEGKDALETLLLLENEDAYDVTDCGTAVAVRDMVLARQKSVI